MIRKSGNRFSDKLMLHLGKPERDRFNSNTIALKGAIMDVAGWLRNLGLERYEAVFRDNAIDETVLQRSHGESSS